MDSSVQVLDPAIEVRLVVLPSQPINPRRCISLKSEECRSKHWDTEMVEERGEPLLPSLPCDLSYAFQRLGHAFPVLRPARALLARVPLGPGPWLHQLRAVVWRCSLASLLLWPGLTSRAPYISGDGSSPSRCGPRSHCVIGR